VNIVNIMNTAERMNSINRLLAGALQEYRLGTVVGVIIYNDLFCFLGAARCRRRKVHREGTTGALSRSQVGGRSGNRANQLLKHQLSEWPVSALGFEP
jgi:hypothetical protein